MTEREQCPRCESYLVEAWVGIYLCPFGCDDHLIDDEDLDPPTDLPTAQDA